MCHSVTWSRIPGGSLTAIRNYEQPSTAVFERMHKVNRVGLQKYPLLKRRHYILNKIEHPVEYKKTMKCILTEEIEGIGLKGSVVEVPKRLFRNQLYINGQAVYASPENLELYEEYRKESEEEGIDYEIKQLMKKMAGFHLRVFMNSKETWTLTPAHLRIAFRKMGIALGQNNIIMPEEPIQQIGDFSFKIQMNDRIASQIRGTIYPLDNGGLPDPSIEYPPMWDNPPIDPSQVIEFIRQKSNSETAESDSSTQNHNAKLKEVPPQDK